MKRMVLMLAFVASAVLTMSADNYNFLTVQQSDGTEQSFTASGLTITFSDGNMVLNENGTTTTLALSDLNKMFFSTTSGIREVETEGLNRAANVDVYDLQGRKVAEGMPIATLNTQLPKGVYIVKQGNASVKITIK